MATTEGGEGQVVDNNDTTLFKPISGDDGANEVTEVESYCINCGKNGITKLLLTSIPFYKEIILASFRCPHCDFENNEIQSAGEIQPKGIRYVLKATGPRDLNRQVIKTDYASLKIPELDLEIPAKSQKGEITNVEGILQRIIAGLEQDQERRKIDYPEDYEKINAFLDKVRTYLSAEEPFSVLLSDISGNSFISPPPNVLPGHKDDDLQLSRFERSKEENQSLGLYDEADLAAVEEVDDAEANPSVLAENDEKAESGDAECKEDLYQEVLEFVTNCPNCGVICSTKMKLTKIPYFKEVVVMATDCEKCGSRTNEVKSGSGIEKLGRKIELRVTSVDDLCRDVLKAETCYVEIPELELEVGAGTLGGKFTTLEGLLCDIKNQLAGDNPLITGDSAQPGMQSKMDAFVEKMEKLISCDHPFVVILDDPAGNSYLQNIYAPDDDPEMKITEYERSFEQNEELGLNDMNTGDGEVDT